MKLSSRERILMMVLALAGFLAAFYYLLLSPQLLALETAKTKAGEYKVKVQEMKAQMDPNHPIYTEFKAKQTEVTEKTARLYPAILQDKIITELDLKFKAVGLNPDSVAFVKTQKTVGTDQNAVNAQQVDFTALRQNYINIGKPLNQAASVEIPEIFRMHELTASIDSTSSVGDFQKLVNFIAALEKDKYKIIINSINMNTAEDGTINSNFSLGFISVPKLFEGGDKEYLDWLLKYDSSRNNPFVGSGSPNPNTSGTPVDTNTTPAAPTPTPATKPTTPVATPPAPSISSDFAVTLRPISSDVPTVLVGKVNDRGPGAYVYADNPGFENVEIQIIETGGKLYYRYKTTSDSYPTDYSEMTAFTAKSTGVIIEVISSKRVDGEDKSGINLSVVNKSSKKVTVTIKNDDSSRSRVKMGATSGSVSVKR